jgi:hypothetical protein
MRRRKLLIGMGTLAAGSATAMGTGAFTAMSAGRDTTINVVSGADGLVALSPGPNITSDIVRESDNPGKLVVDTCDGSTDDDLSGTLTVSGQ